jgi:hypothetical protein
MKGVQRLLFAAVPLTCETFMSWEQVGGWQELRTEARLMALTQKTLSDPTSIEDNANQGVSGITRLMLDGGVGGRISYSINIYQSLELHLGRQPINLATNYFFTPNDLFTPSRPTL